MKDLIVVFSYSHGNTIHMQNDSKENWGGQR